MTEANYCPQYENVEYQIIPDNNVPDNVGASLVGDPFSIDPTTVVYEVESKANHFMKQCLSSFYLPKKVCMKLAC